LTDFAPIKTLYLKSLKGAGAMVPQEHTVRLKVLIYTDTKKYSPNC